MSVDTHDITFQRVAFFKNATSSTCWKFLDVLFINLIVRQVIVFCWWSLWSLENKFLPLYSGVENTAVLYDSLLLGYLGSLLCLMLDLMVQKMTVTKVFMVRSTVMVVTVLSFFSSVNVWRGLWSLLNHYFLPNINHDEN